MPKPSAIDGSTLLATKGSPATVSGSVQRGQSTPPLVDLNFKVPREFRLKFKRLALDAELKNIQLLMRCVAAYEREQQSTKVANVRELARRKK